MNKKIFNLISIVIVFAGVVAGVYIFKTLSKRPNISESDMKKESAVRVLNLNGKVKSQNEADLGFEIGGKILELNYKVGDHVSKGSVLARVDSSDLNSQYQAAQSQVASAKAILEKDQQLVKVNEYKLKSLKNSDSANSNDKKAQDAQVLADKATVESQKAEILSLEAATQGLKANLEKTVLIAPFDGMIAKQNIEIGEIAVSNTVNPLPIITFINDNNFEIDAFASELDIKNISVGQNAKVTLDSNGQQTLNASVTAVDPAATLINNVSSYKITLNFADSNLKLSSGADANIEINLGD